MNVHPLMQLLLASGKCSFVDLNERMSLEDAYVVLEAIYVERHNENEAQRQAWEKGAEKGRMISAK